MLFLKQDGSDELSGPLYDWVIFFFFSFHFITQHVYTCLNRFNADKQFRNCS